MRAYLRDYFPLKILLIFTQRDLAIAKLRIIRRKQKNTFLYHYLLLCDCSSALICAQEYILLSFFPSDKMCWITKNKTKNQNSKLGVPGDNTQ